MSFQELLTTDARPGWVTWIGLRPARRADVIECDAVALTEAGLEGDHAKSGPRAVTLFQSEHLAAVAAFLDRPAIEPAGLRRNIHIAGLNLASLRHAEMAIGDAVIKITGACAPCSRMQETLGSGGYNALRGHGGWYAQVLRPGQIRRGDRAARIPV